MLFFRLHNFFVLQCDRKSSSNKNMQHTINHLIKLFYNLNLSNQDSDLTELFVFDLAKELTFTKITTHTRTLISMVPHYCLAFGPLRHLVSICLLCMDGLANTQQMRLTMSTHSALSTLCSTHTNYVYTLSTQHTV